MGLKSNLLYDFNLGWGLYFHLICTWLIGTNSVDMCVLDTDEVIVMVVVFGVVRAFILVVSHYFWGSLVFWTKVKATPSPLTKCLTI